MEKGLHVFKFYYLDTNIFSYLAKNKTIWNSLFEFLSTHDLCLGLSSAQVSELSDAENLHSDLVKLLMSVPSAIIKTWDMILEEEVKSHPHRRSDSLLLYPLNQLILDIDGPKKLSDFLVSSNLRDARKKQRQNATLMKERLDRLKINFPLSESGEYTQKQSEEFAWQMVIQWLARDYPNFLSKFKDKISDFHSEVFLSLRLYALTIFYKYYLAGREPNKLSDYADLPHLFLIPYCKLAIIERDLCNVLNQIKSHHDVLDLTVVKNIDFFDNWEYEDIE